MGLVLEICDNDSEENSLMPGGVFLSVSYAGINARGQQTNRPKTLQLNKKTKITLILQAIKMQRYN